MRYRVTWCVDTTASSAQEAAGFATEIMDQAHTATVFKVQEHSGDVGTLIEAAVDGEAGTNRYCYVSPLAQLELSL